MQGEEKPSRQHIDNVTDEKAPTIISGPSLAEALKPSQRQIIVKQNLRTRELSAGFGPIQ